MFPKARSAWGVDLWLAGALGWTSTVRGTRLEARALGPLGLVVDAGWRISFLEETIFVFGTPEDSRTSTMQLVPLTAGLRVTF